MSMIKDVIVNLSGREPQDFAADFALSIAKTLGAEVIGAAFLFEPVIPDTMFGGIPTDVIDIQRAENLKAAKEAISRFETAARSAGVAYQTRTLDATFGSAAALFAQVARRFDLSVLGQARPEGGPGEELMIEGALFESGRPLVIVPFIQKQGLTLERVLICWDGSSRAARAIGDALPFLQRARAVELVMVNEHGKLEQVTGANMAAHLLRHGIAVEIRRLSAGDIDIHDVLLSYAADRSADFIVMGGYGHSRLREFILGGVTRGILRSMTAPVLMSH
jgi:nucleotide-binding universal stress UspA family protein